MTVKISQVDVFNVGMPLVDTFTSGGVSKNITKCVVVRVTATDGAAGISSIDPSSKAVSPNTAPELTVAIQKLVGPALIGEDPGNVNRIVELASKLAPTQPGASAGVELACVDLICRRMGVALHDYLGGAVLDRVLFNGWVGELPADEAAVEAKRWQDAGFKSLKIKVGNEVDKDSNRVAAVRDAVGSDMKLRMDANQQCNVSQALALCHAVKSCDMQLFEQPTPKDDLEGLAQVRKEGGLPIMADESISDHQSLIRVIKADCADFVKFGIKQAGGLLSSARMLATAEAAGLPVVLGHGFGLDLSTMAEIMLGATSRNVVPGLECVGPLKVVDTVAATRLDISRGSIPLPSGPGLGIDLDDEKLAQYTV
ncbi:MAG: mandelate racemase/muconate lactonizing enzyme family protein [Rhodospirillaceae bacterium]|nr:mandelate racemase/muconate lactonizing enzyme family protein [Rhodospirillaceae bacterium]MBT5667736.1 mandelate racemase/muconate lactonizing enzyme family protein [Rhodospirillaceae bacterium]MBT5810192.1 mandelate racemase/muconate lactonizing enzyme family protein [Rhodospirillaceae bacterium]